MEKAQRLNPNVIEAHMPVVLKVPYFTPKLKGIHQKNIIGFAVLHLSTLGINLHVTPTPKKTSL